MNATQHEVSGSDRELVLSRIVDAARVRHGSVTDRETHEKMGFDEGRGKATYPLVELVATL